MDGFRPSLGGTTWGEICSQPVTWDRAVAQAGEELGGFPLPGERVLIMGCGTSFYVAGAWARLRESAGEGLTDAVIASEYQPTGRTYDRIVAISRSGTSVDVVDALDRRSAGAPLTAVLGVTDTPVGHRADHIIDLGYADETSVVQTRFPTTLLTLVRARLGEQGLDGLISQGAEVIARGIVEPMPRQLVVLGTGFASELAQEAALKCRESAGLWAEAYATGEYRHGPISVCGEGTLVWGLTPLPGSVVDAVSAAGGRVRQPSFDPLAELVSLQLHAVAWADSVGRDADVPQHLSRSVMII